MQFEFDIKKSQDNQSKHGIDFIEAQSLWSDPRYVLLKTKSDVELRYMAIGMINSKIWSAIFTYRGKAIRIISVRRARKEEIEFYEKFNR